MEPSDLVATLHRAGEVEQKRLVPEIAADGASALPVLVAAYETARTGRLRCCVIDANWAIDDPRVLPVLMSGLQDEGSSVRVHAVEALVQRRDPVACELLLPVLEDRSAAVRQCAIAGLARLGCRSEDAVAGLMVCARDADWRIRQEGEARFGASGSERQRRGPCPGARSLGDLKVMEAEGHLHVLAVDPRNAVRKAAEVALARLGERMAGDRSRT